jgi:hypothetical protein
MGARLLKFSVVLLAVSVAAASGAFAGPRGAVRGTIQDSKGHKVSGHVFMTGGKPLRLRNAKGHLEDIPLRRLRRLVVNVTDVRIEKEWRFKGEGDPTKVTTGRTYPRLDFSLTVTPLDGKPKTYRIPRGQPIYVLPLDGARGKPPARQRFILRPYLKGKIGQTPEDLVYPKDILLGTIEHTEDLPGDAPPTGPSRPKRQRVQQEPLNA